MKGKKTGGRDFQPGKSGNPKGRTPIPAEIRNIKNLTAKELEQVCSFLLTAKESDVHAVLIDPDAPMQVKVIAKALIKAEKDGNLLPLEMLWNRSVGKVKEKLELLGKPSILVTTDGKQYTFTHKKTDGDN